MLLQLPLCVLLSTSSMSWSPGASVVCGTLMVYVNFVGVVVPAGTVIAALPFAYVPVIVSPILLGTALCWRNQAVVHGFLLLLVLVFVNQTSSRPVPAARVAPLGYCGEQANTPAR